MADKELKGARISRGSLRNSAHKNFGLLEALLKRLESAEEGILWKIYQGCNSCGRRGDRPTRELGLLHCPKYSAQELS